MIINDPKNKPKNIVINSDKVQMFTFTLCEIYVTFFFSFLNQIRIYEKNIIIYVVSEKKN